jgi:hypothetical protein
MAKSHLREIDYNDEPPASDDPGDHDGKEARFTPHIQHSRSRLDVGFEYLLRLVEKATDRIVDEEAHQGQTCSMVDLPGSIRLLYNPLYWV